MGMGDTIKGGVQSMLHGGAWLANKVAPDSQFTKDINAAVPQVDSTIANQETAYQAQRQANQPQNLSGLITGQKPAPGIDWARLGGNVTSLAPMAMAAPEMGAMGMGGRMAVGAGLGAQNAAFQPVTDNTQPYADQKTNQLGIGTLAGGVAAPLASALGSAISGVGGAAQKQLAKAGVTMTPGQILGGAWARAEDKLTSVPILGDMIKNAQQRGADSFNSATYNQVLAPLGQKYSGPIGNEGVAAVKQTISDAYDNTLSKMNFQMDQPFMADLQHLGGMAQNLPAQQQQTFANVVKTQILGKLGPKGNMDGETLKGVQSELGRMASGYASDPSFDNRQLGDAISALKGAVDSALPRSNTPELAQQLQNANAAYANFVRLRSAAGSQGAMNNGGVFTAAQLNNAVRANDKSVGKGATATGNALMQDLSSAGQQVLGAKYPNSGTPGRAAIMSALGMLGGGGAAMAGYGPQALAGAGVGAVASLPYTQIGQRLAQALMMSRPAVAAPIGQAVQKYGVPSAAALGAALANSPNR